MALFSWENIYQGINRSGCLFAKYNLIFFFKQETYLILSKICFCVLASIP